MPSSRSRTPVTPAPETPSIAVLPFEDMSQEKNQEYMADGIADELLNLLSQVPNLKVIARTSSFSFKGQQIDIGEIARRLGVAHILEGAVLALGHANDLVLGLERGVTGAHADVGVQRVQRQPLERFLESYAALVERKVFGKAVLTV